VNGVFAQHEINPYGKRGICGTAVRVLSGAKRSRSIAHRSATIRMGPRPADKPRALPGASPAVAPQPYHLFSRHSW
jgi:hypothetical protein